MSNKFHTEVTIYGNSNSKQLTAKWDNGADRTAIDMGVAAAVNAGPVVSSVKTRQTSGVERRPVVPIWVQVNGQIEAVEVGLSDREEMSTDVLLGQDIIQVFDSVQLAP